MNMAGPTKSDIFAMYVSMRQSGQAPDEVVKSLTDVAYQLSREDRHALGRAVQDWETSNGARYAGDESPAAQAPVITAPPKPVQPNQQPGGQPLPQSSAPN